MRIKRSVNALKKRRAILKQAKGYRGSKSKLYRIAMEAVMKSGNYAYIGRRLKKRDLSPFLIYHTNVILSTFCVISLSHLLQTISLIQDLCMV